MFEFKAVIDSIDTIPVDFRGLYEVKEGKAHLRAEDPGVKSAVSAIQGLQGALTKARGEVKALSGKVVDLSALEQYGSTPAEIAQGIEKAISEATKGKKGPEEIQQAVKAAQQAMAEAHGKELKTLQDRASMLTQHLHTHLFTSEARAALAEAGALNADLVLPFLQQQVLVAEENGRFSVQVKGPDGNPRYSGVGTGPMTVKELVTEMRAQEQFKPFFKSDKPSGGGTPGSGGGTPRPGAGTENLSPTQKIAAGLGQRR